MFSCVMINFVVYFETIAACCTRWPTAMENYSVISNGWYLFVPFHCVWQQDRMWGEKHLLEGDLRKRKTERKFLYYPWIGCFFSSRAFICDCTLFILWNKTWTFYTLFYYYQRSTRISHTITLESYFRWSLITWPKSYFPLIHFSFKPGTSFVLPGRTMTTLCSCKLCPSPGTWANISFPLLKRTSTHFRLAEFGFLGFFISVFNTIPFNIGTLYPRGFFDGFGCLGFILWRISSVRDRVAVESEKIHSGDTTYSS